MRWEAFVGIVVIAISTFVAQANMLSTALLAYSAVIAKLAIAFMSEVTRTALYLALVAIFSINCTDRDGAIATINIAFCEI